MFPFLKRFLTVVISCWRSYLCLHGKHSGLLAWLGAGLLLSALNVAAEPRNVQVFGDDAYPPYAYVANGEMQGIYTDVLKEVFKSMPEYRVQFLGIPWKRGLLEAEQGDIFALYPPYHHPVKRPYMDYDLPILNEEVVAYCHKDVLKEPKPNWPEDYYGLTIGNNLGFYVGGEAMYKAAKERKIKLLETSGSRNNLLNLLAGKVDCYINDYFSIQWELNKIAKERQRRVDRTDFKKGAVISSEQGYLGFAVNAEKYPFKEDFKAKYLASLKELKKTDFIQTVIEKHVNQYVEEKNTVYYSVTNVSWPPYWIVETHKISGIFHDVMGELDSRLNYRFLPSNPMPVKRARRIFHLGDTHVECCVDAIWRHSPEDEKVSLWTDVLMGTKEIIVYRDDVVKVPTALEDLRGKRVATVLGYGYLGDEFFVREDSPDNVAQLNKVGIGGVSYAIIDHNEFQYIMKNSPQLKKYRGKLIAGPAISNSELRLRVHVNRSELVKPINQAVRAMNEDGTVQKLIKKYIP